MKLHTKPAAAALPETVTSEVGLSGEMRYTKSNKNPKSPMPAEPTESDFDGLSGGL